MLYITGSSPDVSVTFYLYLLTYTVWVQFHNLTTIITHQLFETVVVGDPVAALPELVHESHDVERVEPVHDGGSERCRAEDAPRVTALADRPQLVLAPGVAHVAVPRVLHHLEHKTSVLGRAVGKVMP